MRHVIKLYENAFRQAEMSGAQVPNEVAQAYLEHKDRRELLRHFRIAVMGTWLFLAGLIAALFLAGCAGRQHPRSIRAEHESAVMISAVCTQIAPGMPPVYSEAPRGSGVVISSTQVLTALHVVAEAECSYFIELADGTKRAVFVEMAWAPFDVARLSLYPGSLFPYTRLQTGPVPEPGEDVCIVSAIPQRTRRCGEVQYYQSPTPGDIGHTAITEPGNSGSGVYDGYGRLVGTVTHLLHCVNGQICGGRFASLRAEFFQ